MDFSDYSDLNPSVHWAQLHHTLRHHEYPLRRIYDFELLYLIAGRIKIQLGSSSYSVSSGELIFIRAGLPHKIKIEEDERALFYGIHFDFFDEITFEFDQEIIVDESSPERFPFCKEAVMAGQAPLSDIPVMQPPQEIVRSIERLIEEFNHGLPGVALYCKGLMLQILIDLFRFSAHGRSLHPNNRERLKTVAEWIDLNYSGDCSGKALAGMLNLNEDHLAKQFKAAYGMTPNKYVQLIRHREAKRMLRETTESVENIANAVGFDDLHYFSRMFRKWEGVSPRAYRNRVTIY